MKPFNPFPTCNNNIHLYNITFSGLSFKSIPVVNSSLLSCFIPLGTTVSRTVTNTKCSWTYNSLQFRKVLIESIVVWHYLELTKKGRRFPLIVILLLRERHFPKYVLETKGKRKPHVFCRQKKEVDLLSDEGVWCFAPCFKIFHTAKYLKNINI